MMVMFLISFASALTEIDSCGTLDTPGETYVLNQSIFSHSTCIQINANNVVLDGNGYDLIGNNSYQRGIWLNGDDHVVIKNFRNIVNMSPSYVDNFIGGIWVRNAENLTIENITFIDNGFYDIKLENVINSSVEDINIYNKGGYGILLDEVLGVGVEDSVFSNIYIEQTDNVTSAGDIGIVLLGGSSRNTFEDIIITGHNAYDYSSGFYLGESSNNNTIRNLTANYNDVGVYSTGVSGNILKSVTANHNVDEGITVFASTNINLTNIIANNNSDRGVAFYSSSDGGKLYNISTSGSAQGVLFSDSSYSSMDGLTSTGNGYAGLRYYNSIWNNATNINVNSNQNGLVFDGVTGNTSILNIQSFNNSALAIKDGAGNSLKYDNSFGEINFLSPFGSDITANITYPGTIVISDNFVEVDSANVPDLNISANVTLRGIPTNGYNYQILKNGEVCGDCVAITPLNAGTVKFEVQSWSNYSIGYDVLYSCDIYVSYDAEEDTSSDIGFNNIIVGTTGLVGNFFQYTPVMGTLFAVVILIIVVLLIVLYVKRLSIKNSKFAG